MRHHERDGTRFWQFPLNRDGQSNTPATHDTTMTYIIYGVDETRTRGLLRDRQTF